MNLYNLHENPRLLHRYHDAMVKLPDVAFAMLSRYYNNLSLAEKYNGARGFEERRAFLSLCYSS